MTSADKYLIEKLLASSYSVCPVCEKELAIDVNEVWCYNPNCGMWARTSALVPAAGPLGYSLQHLMSQELKIKIERTIRCGFASAPTKDAMPKFEEVGELLFETRKLRRDPAARTWLEQAQTWGNKFGDFLVFADWLSDNSYPLNEQGVRDAHRRATEWNGGA